VSEHARIAPSCPQIATDLELDRVDRVLAARGAPDNDVRLPMPGTSNSTTLTALRALEEHNTMTSVLR
jgi:hypothetical protein